MSGRNLDSFLADADAADAFSALADDDKARLFAGESLQDDTGSPSESSAPSAAAAEDEPQESPQDEPATGSVADSPADSPTDNPEPVLLAKDGVHTIPYSELEEARERARMLEQQLQAIQQPPNPPPEQHAEPDIAAMVRERDGALFAGDTDLANRISLQIIDVQQERAVQAAVAALRAESVRDREAQARAAELDAAQASADVLVAKYDFLNPGSAAVNQDAIDLVVAQRDRLMASGVSLVDAIEQAVGKVAPLFVKAAQATTTGQNADAASRAAEVIAKTRPRTPTSLSQVPAGAQAHHDDREALLNDHGLSLIGRFQGKTPDEIERLIARAI